MKLEIVAADFLADLATTSASKYQELVTALIAQYNDPATRGKAYVKVADLGKVTNPRPAIASLVAEQLPEASLMMRKGPLPLPNGESIGESEYIAWLVPAVPGQKRRGRPAGSRNSRQIQAEQNESAALGFTNTARIAETIQNEPEADNAPTPEPEPAVMVAGSDEPAKPVPNGTHKRNKK